MSIRKNGRFSLRIRVSDSRQSISDILCEFTECAHEPGPKYRTTASDFLDKNGWQKPPDTPVPAGMTASDAIDAGLMSYYDGMLASNDAIMVYWCPEANANIGMSFREYNERGIKRYIPYDPEHVVQPEIFG